MRCIVTALTGAAAVAVDGQTVHTALNHDLQTAFFSESDFKRIPAHKLDLMKDLPTRYLTVFCTLYLIKSL